MKDKTEQQKYFTVLDPIFHRKVHIFLNYSNEDYQKWCKKKGVEDERDSGKEFSATSFEFDHDSKPTEWAIHIKRFNWSIGSQGTLIHEIVHTIIKIWSINHIPYNKDTQEFLAHSIANLYEDIAAKIMNVKKIKR